MAAAQGKRESQRSQCQQKKTALRSGLGQDRTALHRPETAAESLNPARTPSCKHTAGSSKQFVFPWGGAAEQHSDTQSVQHAPWLHRMWCTERQEEQIYSGKEMRKEKNPNRKKETQVSWSLIRYSSSAFSLLIYMKIYSVCRGVPGCCCSLCDSKQSGMWGCKFLLHLVFSLSLCFSAGCSFNADYVSVILCYLLTSYFPPSLPSLFLHLLSLCHIHKDRDAQQTTWKLSFLLCTLKSSFTYHLTSAAHSHWAAAASRLHHVDKWRCCCCCGV